MLRDTKSPPLNSSTWQRGAVIALTLAAGVFVTGLRPPGDDHALAQEIVKPQAAEVSSEFNLEHVPGTTKVLLGLRPAQIAGRPELQPLVKYFNEIFVTDKTGIRFENIDQVLVIVGGPSVLDADEPDLRSPVIEVRMTRPTDFSAFAENQNLTTIDAVNAQPGGPRLTTEQRLALRENGAVRQQFLTMIHEESAHRAMDVVDERTMLYGRGKDVWALLDDLDRISRRRPEWLDKFESVSADHACLVDDVAAFRLILQQEFERSPNPLLGTFVPLWENTELAIAGANINDNLSLSVTGWTTGAESTAQLKQGLESALLVAEGMLPGAKQSLKHEPEDKQPLVKELIAFAETALEGVKFEQDAEQVTMTLEGDGTGMVALVTTVLPAVAEGREAAKRTWSKSNLHNIALAFHGYHVIFGHFPPQTLYGPDGKTPYSWRVELLPVLKHYTVKANRKKWMSIGPFDREAYNKQITEFGYDLSQPWDSEQNRTVLEQIPDVFRHPTDNTGSTNTGYFCLVGEHTVFDNGTGPRNSGALGGYGTTDSNPEMDEKAGSAGVGIQEITDGTSNTLMIVEAQRDVPWTKPEDIPYNPDKDLPPLGGFWTSPGFFAALADGSVKFISEAIDEATLRNLITRDDGNPIPRD